MTNSQGLLAQLVERCTGIAEVIGFESRTGLRPQAFFLQLQKFVSITTMIFFLANSLDMVVVGGATDDSQSRVASKFFSVNVFPHKGINLRTCYSPASPPNAFEVLVGEGRHGTLVD